VTKGKRKNHEPRSESGVKGLRAKSVALVRRVSRAAGDAAPRRHQRTRKFAGDPISGPSVSTLDFRHKRERFFLASQSARGARRLNYIKDDVARTHTPKAFYKTRVSRVWRRFSSWCTSERLRSHTRRCARCQKAPRITTRAPCQKVEQTDAEKRLNWNWHIDFVR